MRTRFSTLLLTTAIATFALFTLSEHGLAAAPSPADFLGRRIGTDFELADWTQVSGYYRELAKQSPHVQLNSAGKTTEGRDFLYAVISSEENLERIDELKKYSSWIADPRQCTEEGLQTAISDGRPILFITPSMHSNEPASTEMGMHLAWQLATSDEKEWTTFREQLVVVILPSLNPDGVDHIVKWYREKQGTSEEGSEMLKLYQYYTGHDNNRDWFSLTQKETQLLTRLLYKEWFPQVLWDPHQYGSQKERFFVPPYRDPLNPNLDPGIVAGINALGNRAILDMTEAGLSGIACGVSYDNWWNGGNRSVPCRHNIIGLLTEAASVNIASPVFIKKSDLKDPLGRSEYRPSNLFISPWKGGWWRLSDIHQYQLAFGQSIMGSLSREPEFWLKNATAAAQRTIEQGRHGSPRGWIIPTDQHDLATLQRLTKLLLDSGIELHTATASFELVGRTYPAGTLIIGRDQPYGNYAKDLFEFKNFPSGETPYDVAGWSLGALFGLHIVEAKEALPDARQKVASSQAALAAFKADPRLRNAPEGSLSTGNLQSWTELAKRLKNSQPHVLVSQGELAGTLIPQSAISRLPSAEEGEVLESLPRIGVYAPWDPSMDEGWLRWTLDTSGIPYQRVRNETIAAGQLNDLFDVLIVPDLSSRTLEAGRSSLDTELPYLGGLEGAGLAALEEFVISGGKLIACDTSANWLVKQWNLPVKDLTLEAGRSEFHCSGSVVRSRPVTSRLTAGLPEQIPLMFAHSKAWEMTEIEEPAENELRGEFKSHLNYTQTAPLISGHMKGPEVIAGKSAWTSGSYGKGTIHLFGFRPYYRGWSQGTFGLLFRSLFLSE